MITIEKLLKYCWDDGRSYGANRSILNFNDFKNMYQEQIKLVSLNKLELFNNYSEWYNSLSEHERDEFSTVSALEHYLFKIIK